MIFETKLTRDRMKLNETQLAYNKKVLENLEVQEQQLKQQLLDTWEKEKAEKVEHDIS